MFAQSINKSAYKAAPAAFGDTLKAQSLWLSYSGRTSGDP